MRCECKECKGTGRIRCNSCVGVGTHYISILDHKSASTHKHYKELMMLKGDAKRAYASTRELKKMMPDRGEALDRQLVATLESIDRDAEILERKQ